MPVMETPDDTDDRLRELFCSFDSSSVRAAYGAGERSSRLTRGRAVAWAVALAAALVVALVSVDLVQSKAARTPVGPAPTSKVSTTGTCAESQLVATVVFNQLGTELGAIKFTNIAGRACALSGRPQIVVYDGAGHSLGLKESADDRAPDLPAPTKPIELAASGSSDQAIVEVDWCGFATSAGHIDIRFAGWNEPLVEQDSSIEPSGFSPPSCLDPSQQLLAVDYVRGSKNGGVVLQVPTVTATPAHNLHSGQRVDVIVHGFSPRSPLFVSECASAADYTSNPSGCGMRQSSGSTNGSGDDSVTFDVQVLASSAAGSAPSVTCTDQCVIVASSTGHGPGPTSAYVPVQFAAGARQTSECNFTQLAVSARGAGAGLGHVGVVLLFKNTGNETCGLFGYPGVAGLNTAGVQVTEALRTLFGYLGGTRHTSEVVIAPGESASALVEGTDNPAGNATSCPTYPNLLVTPPNTTRSVTIHIAMLGCSRLQVHPVVPGTTGSAPNS